MFRFFNSYTKKRELFKPLKDKTVRMYNCGPTVYDFIHIGNLRAFLFADTLRRTLEYSGYKVKQVMNITDVGHLTQDQDEGEDKIELSAKKEKKSPKEIALFYEKAFFKDIKELNIRPAYKYPRATQHIKEMIDLVKILLKKGYAYQVGGNVYFEVKKFKEYGRLSGNTLKKLKAGARLPPHPQKKSPFDFALWISDEKHIMGWPSPWSKHGYPGWHLECSVMSRKYLGQPFDIHTGGEDNKFPHHECEIAQSKAAFGKPLARFWLHVKHLLVEGNKMAKSLGNFYTLNDIKKKGFHPSALRLLLISTHYRKPLNFTWEGISSAQEAVERLVNFIIYLKQKKEGKINPKIPKLIQKIRKKFKEALEDDLNLSKALSFVFDFILQINKLTFSQKQAQEIKKFIFEIDEVLGLNLKELVKKSLVPLPSSIKKLIKKREILRNKKKFQEADKIRKKIESYGFVVQDTLSGPLVYKNLFKN